MLFLDVRDQRKPPILCYCQRCTVCLFLTLFILQQIKTLQFINPPQLFPDLSMRISTFQQFDLFFLFRICAYVYTQSKWNCRFCRCDIGSVLRFCGHFTFVSDNSLRPLVTHLIQVHNNISISFRDVCNMLNILTNCPRFPTLIITDIRVVYLI